MHPLIASMIALLLTGSPGPAGHVALAEVVMVEGLGPVSLDAFECTAIGRSTTVSRVCRDVDARRAIAVIGGRHRAYCDLPAGLLDAWFDAPSMGRFHGEHLAGRHVCR